MKLVPLASLLLAAPLAAQGQIGGGQLDHRAAGLEEKYDGPPPPMRVVSRSIVGRDWGRGPLAGPFGGGSLERGPDGLQRDGLRGTTAGAGDTGAQVRQFADAKSLDEEVGFDDPWYWWQKADDAWPVIVEETLNLRELAQRHAVGLDDFKGLEKVIGKMDGEFKGAGLHECGFLVPVRYIEDRARRAPIDVSDIDYLASELKHARLALARDAAQATQDLALRRVAMRRVAELESQYAGELESQVGGVPADDLADNDIRVWIAKQRMVRAIGYVRTRGIQLDSSDVKHLGALKFNLRKTRNARGTGF